MITSTSRGNTYKSKEKISVLSITQKNHCFATRKLRDKKSTNLFDVAMGAYDGAEVCEIVDLFFLNNLGNKFEKNCVGLYRDDGLALFKNINGHRGDKIRKEFHQLLKESGLSLETECNLKIVKYLDITLDLNTDTYKPYRKPDDEIIYIHAKTNHPANILKQIPTSIKTRLSNLSSNSEIFHEASKY